MRSKLITRALPALAVLASVAMPTSAHAAFVNSWNYTVTSTFSDSQFRGSVGNSTETPETLSWGTETRRSSIGTTNSPRTGVVVTNGDEADANSYFHDNNVLPTGTVFLESTSLQVTIELEPVGGTGGPDLSRTFDINFFETPNAGQNGVCANGGAVGDGINSAGCADIFVLEFNFGQFDFEYDGQSFSAFLFEDPDGPQQLGFLSDEACDFVGAGSGCFGFLTAEDALTVANFVLTVEGQDVPEPAALGLMGLGLLGLGAARRRKA